MLLDQIWALIGAGLLAHAAVQGSKRDFLAFLIMAILWLVTEGMWLVQ